MRTLLLTALCILAGCGTAPPEAAPSGSVAASAAMPQAVALGGELQAEAAGQPNGKPNGKPKGEPKREFKPPVGYKAKIVDWEILYCSKMVVTGSRFPKEVCMTETQLREHVAKNDEMRRDVNRVTRTCTSTEACGGI